MSLRSVYLIFTAIALVLAELKYPHQEYAPIKSYPYLVTVQVSWDTKCIGALLSSFYVLTSAQCVHKAKVEELNIRAGADNYHNSEEFDDYEDQPNNEENIETKVDRIIKLATTKWPYDYDAAILILRPPIITDIGPEISTIIIGAESLPNGSKVKGIGWDPDNGKILINNLEIIDRKKCDETYKLPTTIRENTICAANTECQSNFERSPPGSLLVKDGKLYGLLTVGSFCPTVQYPAIFTDLVLLEQQIRNITEM